jgi:hypothetical protein
VTVDAVIPKKVFGEVFDTHSLHLGTTGFATFNLGQSSVQESGSFGWVSGPRGFSERPSSQVVFHPQKLTTGIAIYRSLPA